MSIAVLVVIVILFEGAYLIQTKIVFLKTDFLASVLPGALIALTNQNRMAYGLTGVTEDSLLNKAAQAAAEDMANKGYFAHVSPDGKTPWYWLDLVGYRHSYAGQNLAVNFTDSENVQTAWMESPTHRANILKPQYTRVGFGTANGIYEGKETTFVVQFFATPAVEVEGIAPARVALATPAEVRPSQEQTSESQTSTTSVRVLGSETDIPLTLAAAPTPTAPASTLSVWLTRMLTSPLNTLTTIFSILLAVIGVSFSVVTFTRGRFQHPSVVIGGIFLLLFVSGAIFASAMFAGSVVLPADNQTANAFTAVP